MNYGDRNEATVGGYTYQYGYSYLPCQPARCDCHECTQARYKMQFGMGQVTITWPPHTSGGATSAPLGG